MARATPHPRGRDRGDERRGARRRVVRDGDRDAVGRRDRASRRTPVDGGSSIEGRRARLAGDRLRASLRLRTRLPRPLDAPEAGAATLSQRPFRGSQGGTGIAARRPRAGADHRLPAGLDRARLSRRLRGIADAVPGGHGGRRRSRPHALAHRRTRRPRSRDRSRAFAGDPRQHRPCPRSSRPSRSTPIA